MTKKKKCIVLFSGGLDSRLVVKIMQEKDFDVVAVHFKLPFGCGRIYDVEEFVKENKIKLKIFNCTKGELLREYLKVLKKAEHGRGTGANPCVDCKIFMFKKAEKFAKDKNIEIIATGEVVGQRPMSQQKKQIEIIEKESGLKGKVVRPLEEFGIKGRQRIKQIELAKKFKIKFSYPAGGCLLCEKLLKKRFEYLLKRKLNEKEIVLAKIGRHFLIDGCWIVLGRNKEENEIIEKLGEGKIISPDFIGPTATILDKPRKDTGGLVEELIFAYSKKGLEKNKKKFEEFRL